MPLRHDDPASAAAEQPADLSRIGAELSRQFPAIGPVEPLRTLGGGFSSLVVETAAGIVFRIARNREAQARQERERRLLPRIRTVLPLAVPDPGWQCAGSETFPFGAIGYRELPGTTLPPRRLDASARRSLAASLGGFLRSLHGFPAGELSDLHLAGPKERDERVERLRSDFMAPLRDALTPGQWRTVSRWWDRFLGNPALRKHPLVLRHGDFWYENILFDPSAGIPTGVLDFENSAIGDPAQDFATLLYHGRPFVKEVIRAYRAAGGDPGEEIDRRIAGCWELRDFLGMQDALVHGDVEAYEDSVRKLREGPILGREGSR